MGIVLTDIDLLNMNTAISTNFLLWALLMFSCPDPGWTTKAEEMASLEVKMTNIMDRMTRMEAEMVAREEMMEVLKDAMETKDKRIAVLEDQVRNQPFAYQCAWRNGFWTEANSVITYDRLTTDEMSGSSMYNVTGGLDINTGVFTVGQGFSGVWKISYGIESYQDNGDQNLAWLYINGEQIKESRHNTFYGGSSGWLASLGSRSLYMRLEAGDTISLRSGKLGHGLYEITLCFELAQIDFVPPNLRNGIISFWAMTFFRYVTARVNGIFLI